MKPYIIKVTSWLLKWSPNNSIEERDHLYHLTDRCIKTKITDGPITKISFQCKCRCAFLTCESIWFLQKNDSGIKVFICSKYYCLFEGILINFSLTISITIMVNEVLKIWICTFILGFPKKSDLYRCQILY